MAKRVLWLLNHNTLMKSEVRIMQELGYEVYVPKKPPFDLSVRVDWTLDQKLTIPKEHIDILNNFDFYMNDITKEIADIINRYFDIAVFMHNANCIKSIVDHFLGLIIYRAFGRLSVEGSYTDVVLNTLGTAYLKKISNLGNRFVFGYAFEEILDKECDIFCNKSVYLPYGLNEDQIEDSWTGKQKKVLFICPRINTSQYFESIYREFKKNFKGIPYSIGGGQPISIENDSSVLGFLDREEYDNLYPSHIALFYPYQERRHIHYVPFEAIKCGLPLVFMAGGRLDLMGGRNLPGRCKTIKEARRKIQRLINGDKKLAERIRSSQPALLKEFSYAHCYENWEKAFRQFEKILEENHEIKYIIKKKFRLGILLPAGYTGGVLDYTIRLIKAIRLGAIEAEDSLEIVFGYIDAPIFETRDWFKELIELDIPIRKFTIEQWEQLQIKEALKLSELTQQNTSDFYAVLNDGIAYFGDCNFLLFTADRILRPLFTLSPYAVVIHDYIQRFIPEVIGSLDNSLEFFDFARKAHAVLTTTDCTKRLAVQYAGIPTEKIHVYPNLFETNENNTDEFSKNMNKSTASKHFFLWSTNTNPHKNHKFALNTLSEYYQLGGKLECVITGVKTDLFNLKNKYKEGGYIQEIRDIISNDKNLKRKITAKGNMPKRQFLDTLKDAAYFIHFGYADNGNITAVDAGLLGVPTVSSDYPAMREMNEKVGLNMKFFDLDEPEKLAQRMLEWDLKLDELKEVVPTHEELAKKTIDHPSIYNEIYRVVKTACFPMI